LGPACIDNDQLLTTVQTFKKLVAFSDQVEPRREVCPPPEQLGYPPAHLGVALGIAEGRHHDI
jgi:hypothetical protein